MNITFRKPDGSYRPRVLPAVPRVGDGIRLHRVLYRVVGVIWDADAGADPCCVLEVPG